MSGGAMRQSTYSSVTPNAMPTQNLKTNTSATRVVLARRPRPNNVRRGRVLPASGWVRPKKLAQLLCLSALNVGTLTGGSRELADTHNNRRIDIACIQETKWKGAKARDIGEGFKLFYNGNQAQNGVGIAVSQKLRDSVVEMTHISDCLMSLKVNTGSAIMDRLLLCAADQLPRRREGSILAQSRRPPTVNWPRRTPGNRR